MVLEIEIDLRISNPRSSSRSTELGLAWSFTPFINSDRALLNLRAHFTDGHTTTHIFFEIHSRKRGDYTTRTHPLLILPVYEDVRTSEL